MSKVTFDPKYYENTNLDSSINYHHTIFKKVRMDSSSSGAILVRVGPLAHKQERDKKCRFMMVAHFNIRKLSAGKITSVDV